MKLSLKNMVMMACMAIFLTASISAMAQDDKSQKKTPAEKAKMMTEKMKTDLTLNDDQTTRVESANLDFITKKEALKHAGDKTGLDGKMKSLNDEHNAALKGILNDQQYKKFIEMESKHGDKRKEKA